MQRTLIAVGLAGLVVMAAIPAADAESARAWSIAPEKGFIDDPLAFDAAGARLAYVHTDAASFLEIVVVQLDGFKKVAEAKVEDATRIPKRLAFTPDGKHIVMLWMDGYKGTRGAMVFDAATGKQIKSSRTATHARIVPHKGQQVVALADVKTDKQGRKRVTVTAHRTPRLRRAGRARTVVAPDLMLKRPPVRLLYWEPGHVSLVGMKKGKYDTKRDVRLPDRAVRYNLLLRKVTWSEAPKEVVDWTRATTMRPNHPGQYQFLEVSDDLKTLYHVSRNNDLGKVTTPVKWKLYEPKSLAQRESWDGKTLYFSMTVDPVNPDAVARKKADPERVDIYRLDEGLKATPIGQVLTKKRRFAWAVGSDHFAYLYKLKGFGRGGKELVVFKAGK